MTSFRRNLRDGIYNTLVTYQAANPSILAHVYDAPPADPRTPCAFVAKNVLESVSNTAQIQQRVARCQVYVLNKLSSYSQAADEQDVLVDGIIDAITNANRTAVSGARISISAVDDGEQTFGTAVYAGAILTVEGAVQEGYSF